MMNYKVCDPSGNITILVTDKVPKENRIEVADDLLRIEPTGEQVGFIEEGDSTCDLIVNMAGDEFCGNATLSAAALYKQSHSDTDIVRVKISGAKEVIDVTVDDTLKASAIMPKPDAYEYRAMKYKDKEYKTFFVRFGPMVHLILIDKLTKDDLEPAIKEWYIELNCSALGLMDYNENTKELTPAVLSNGGEFFCYESSCASGTTALAIYLANRDNKEVEEEIKEPGGVLKIHSKPDGYCRLTNKVKIRD